MKGNSFFYCLGQGFAGIKRNKVFFLASVATIAACIFMVGLLLSVILNVNYIIKEAQDSVCITVFFEPETTDADIQDMRNRIGEWEEVSRVDYTSPEEAWEKFKEEYFKENPELAEGFANDNPLATSASFTIYLTDITYQQKVAERLESMTGIRQVNKSEITASALSDFGKIAGIASLAIIIVLLAVSIFLISNTIATGIAVRAEEIRVMKYVGATDFFVKSPFVFEGIIIGLIGAIVPLIVLFFVYRAAINYVVEQMQTFSSAFAMLPMKTVFSLLIPVALVLGAGIGLIGSSIATNKYIRV
ncbi:MAG: permease-like cell division protein FtsX [Lachnospiraceae bacterium]|nr:permease-like cell division protein FtsX [Lachnospiraceae bacterium]